MNHMTEKAQLRKLEAPADGSETASNYHEPTTESALQPRHGGGPATAEGKLVSSQNARKHSFFSKHLFRPGEETSPEFQQHAAILSALTQQFRPVGTLEELMIEKIAVETTRFARLLQHEREILDRAYPFHDAAADRVLRYQAAINRQLYQAQAQLERLQRGRAGDAVPAPISIDVRVDATAPELSLPDAGSMFANSRPSEATEEYFGQELVAMPRTQTETVTSGDSVEVRDVEEGVARDDSQFCGTNSMSSVAEHDAPAV
jgi:hypothetical protein